MKLLVTGGCGYVGTMLVKRLLDEGHRVTVVDIMWFGNFLQKHKNLNIVQEDIRNIDKVPMENIEAIFHLANVANDPAANSIQSCLGK